jgi:hypothetical protein
MFQGAHQRRVHGHLPVLFAIQPLAAVGGNLVHPARRLFSVIEPASAIRWSDE